MAPRPPSDDDVFAVLILLAVALLGAASLIVNLSR